MILGLCGKVNTPDFGLATSRCLYVFVHNNTTLTVFYEFIKSWKGAVETEAGILTGLLPNASGDDDYDYNIDDYNGKFQDINL